MSVVVCKSYAIGQENILSSSLPANDYQAWSAGSYLVDDLVTHNSHNWQVINQSGTSDEPSLISTDWFDLGLINILRPFDISSDTTAQSITPITYTLKIPDKLVNSIGFLQVEAESIDLVITDAIEGIVYSNTYSMVDIGCDDVVSYWFDDYQYFDRQVDIELPPYYGCEISITINPSVDTNIASIAVLALAVQKVIGGLEWGYETGIEDYSTVNRDPDFGTVGIVKRNYVDKNNFSIVCDTNQMYSIKQALLKLRATPCLWVGSPDRPETIVWGIYAGLGMVAGNARFSNFRLELKGVL